MGSFPVVVVVVAPLRHQYSIQLLDPKFKRARRLRQPSFRMPRWVQRRHSLTGSIAHDRAFFGDALEMGPLVLECLTTPPYIDPIIAGQTTELLTRLAGSMHSPQKRHGGSSASVSSGTVVCTTMCGEK